METAALHSDEERRHLTLRAEPTGRHSKQHRGRLTRVCGVCHRGLMPPHLTPEHTWHLLLPGSGPPAPPHLCARRGWQALLRRNSSYPAWHRERLEPGHAPAPPPPPAPAPLGAELTQGCQERGRGWSKADLGQRDPVLKRGGKANKQVSLPRYEVKSLVARS